MKFLYFFAMGLTVVANVAYHFCQKAISPNANPLYFSGSIPQLRSTVGCTIPQPSTSNQPGSEPSPRSHAMSTSADGSVNGK